MKKSWRAVGKPYENYEIPSSFFKNMSLDQLERLGKLDYDEYGGLMGVNSDKCLINS